MEGAHDGSAIQLQNERAILADEILVVHRTNEAKRRSFLTNEESSDGNLRRFRFPVFALAGSYLTVVGDERMAMQAWDVRDSQKMQVLRADLMACPAELHGDILADFMEDPVVALGFRLRTCVSVVTGGMLFEEQVQPRWWRDVVENVVPVDGRHADAKLLERFLAAAQRAGWSDPRLEPAPTFSRF